MIGFQNTDPGLSRLRLPPAKLSYRGPGVGNARINLYSPVFCEYAGEISLGDVNNIRRFCILPGDCRHPADRRPGDPEHCGKENNQ